MACLLMLHWHNLIMQADDVRQHRIFLDRRKERRNDVVAEGGVDHRAGKESIIVGKSFEQGRPERREHPLLQGPHPDQLLRCLALFPREQDVNLRKFNFAGGSQGGRIHENVRRRPFREVCPRRGYVHVW